MATFVNVQNWTTRLCRLRSPMGHPSSRAAQGHAQTWELLRATSGLPWPGLRLLGHTEASLRAISTGNQQMVLFLVGEEIPCEHASRVYEEAFLHAVLSTESFSEGNVVRAALRGIPPSLDREIRHKVLKTQEESRSAHVSVPHL